MTADPFYGRVGLAAELAGGGGVRLDCSFCWDVRVGDLGAVSARHSARWGRYRGRTAVDGTLAGLCYGVSVSVSLADIHWRVTKSKYWLDGSTMGRSSGV